MTTHKAPICLGCRYFRERLVGGSGSCDAFPTGAGIPLAIWHNDADHRQPFPGDHGLQFVARNVGATEYAALLFAEAHATLDVG